MVNYINAQVRFDHALRDLSLLNSYLKLLANLSQ